MTVDNAGVSDNVTYEIGDATSKDWTRRHTDKVGVVGRVTARLYGPDGNLKYSETGYNLITDAGDDHLANRMFDDAQNIVTGMRLGTGATAAAKAGAGGAIVTYITGSQEALDATAVASDKGAGLGARTTHISTWIAGDVTNAAIAEVVLTDETPLTDVAGVLADTVARFVFGATIDKQAGDSLAVTWEVDFLGS